MRIEPSDATALPFPINFLRVETGGTLRVRLQGEPRPRTLNVRTGETLNQPIVHLYNTGTTARGFTTNVCDSVVPQTPEAAAPLRVVSAGLQGYFTIRFNYRVRIPAFSSQPSGFTVTGPSGTVTLTAQLPPDEDGKGVTYYLDGPVGTGELTLSYTPQPGVTVCDLLTGYPLAAFTDFPAGNS